MILVLLVALGVRMNSDENEKKTERLKMIVLTAEIDLLRKDSFQDFNFNQGLGLQRLPLLMLF